jgi:hypothetical protein
MKYISTLIILILFSFISTAQNSKINPLLIIGKTIKIGNLEIAQNDFPKEMNWLDAKKVSESLTKGWRLPSKDELYILYKNKIDNIKHNKYWSNSEGKYGYVWIQYFDGGQGSDSKNNLNYVRAVRTIK